MKLKYVITLFLVSLAVLVGLMYKYNLDWRLLSSLSFYENLANPSVKVIQIKEGLRK